MKFDKDNKYQREGGEKRARRPESFFFESIDDNKSFDSESLFLKLRNYNNVPNKLIVLSVGLFFRPSED